MHAVEVQCALVIDGDSMGDGETDAAAMTRHRPARDSIDVGTRPDVCAGMPGPESITENLTTRSVSHPDGQRTGGARVAHGVVDEVVERQHQGRPVGPHGRTGSGPVPRVS